MKKMTVKFVLPALVLLITLCSAVPVDKQDLAPENQQKIELLTKQLKGSTADGNLSYDEMKDLATTLKGSKLSFKEKLAIKLFGHKLSKKALDSTRDGDGKSQLIALILVLVVGSLGIHRFYLGYTWQGIVQLLTLGGCGIWSLIDLIRIITGDLKPKDGEYGKTL